MTGGGHKSHNLRKAALKDTVQRNDPVELRQEREACGNVLRTTQLFVQAETSLTPAQIKKGSAITRAKKTTTVPDIS